jgi:molybdenum cofactor cytidylyltransferase
MTLLVLAAGRGLRMGGPKALLIVDGLPLALLHARSSAMSRCVIVVRADVGAVLAPCVQPHEQLVISEQPDELGPAGSIRAALQQSTLGDAILINQVDRLPAAADETAALIRALASHDAARFDPGGHPVAIRGDVLATRYAADAPPLRDVLDDLGTRCARLPRMCPSERSGSREHLSTAADVLRVTGAEPRFFGR